IVCFIIIGIKLQYTSRDTVHHVAAWRFHDNVTHEVRRKRATLRKHILKISQLFLRRQLAEKKQVSCLFKTGMFCIEETFYNIFYVVTAIIKISFAGDGFAVNDL